MGNKVGFNSHRLIENDKYYKKECDFVKAINQELKHNHNFLSQIVNHSEHRDYLTENDEKIALSVIQWLGTPVGQNFLHKVSKM
jgi:hypothetical protein